MLPADPTEDLRRVVLAASVLHDVDVAPGDDGPVLMVAGAPVVVPWSQVRRAVADAQAPGGPRTGRTVVAAVARRLREHAWVAAAGSELLSRLRAVAVPVDAADHPGLDWVASRVLGDSLDIGPGFLGLDPDRPEDVLVLPASLLRSREVDLRSPAWTAAWAKALDHLEAMGTLAAARLRRDPERPLRPYGDCDVVTLLASPTMRRALAAASGGLRTVAVPLRQRGWTDLRRIDPAYAAAAAAAAPDGQAGFRRPLLVSADEVVQAPEGGRPHLVDLRDPAPTSSAWRTDGGTLL